VVDGARGAIAAERERLGQPSEHVAVSINSGPAPSIADVETELLAARVAFGRLKAEVEAPPSGGNGAH
jgi:hypothetical protein